MGKIQNRITQGKKEKKLNMMAMSQDGEEKEEETLKRDDEKMTQKKNFGHLTQTVQREPEQLFESFLKREDEDDDHLMLHSNLHHDHHDHFKHEYPDPEGNIRNPEEIHVIDFISGHSLVDLLFTQDPTHLHFSPPHEHQLSSSTQLLPDNHHPHDPAQNHPHLIQHESQHSLGIRMKEDDVQDNKSIIQLEPIREEKFARNSDTDDRDDYTSDTPADTTDHKRIQDDHSEILLSECSFLNPKADHDNHDIEIAKREHHHDDECNKYSNHHESCDRDDNHVSRETVAVRRKTSILIMRPHDDESLLLDQNQEPIIRRKKSVSWGSNEIHEIISYWDTQDSSGSSSPFNSCSSGSSFFSSTPSSSSSKEPGKVWIFSLGFIFTGSLIYYRYFDLFHDLL